MLSEATTVRRAFDTNSTLQESNNGQIWIESEAGKGTTFHFTIERVAANVKSEEAVTEEQDTKVFRLDTALLRTA